jgi:glucan phosphorylase
LKLEKHVWLKDLTKLEGLLPFAEDKAFRAKWAAIKQRNKERLAHYVQTTLGLIIRTDAMFDVQIKVLRIHSFHCWLVELMHVFIFSVSMNIRYFRSLPKFVKEHSRMYC